jgi:hypothetical protein
MSTLVPKNITIPPDQAPGAGVANALMHALYYVQSASITCSGDATPQSLFNFSANTFVDDIILEVSSAYNGTYILAGIASDADCFISDTSAAVAQVGGQHYSMKSGSNAAIYRGGYNSSCDVVLKIAYDGTAGTIKANVIVSQYANDPYVE